MDRCVTQEGPAALAQRLVVAEVAVAAVVVVVVVEFDYMKLVEDAHQTLGEVVEVVAYRMWVVGAVDQTQEVVHAGSGMNLDCGTVVQVEDCWGCGIVAVAAEHQ